MFGPSAGLYISGLPVEPRLELALLLLVGQTIDVHLMHKHRSGHYEASSLRMHDGQLIMVFDDREEPA